MTHRAWPMVAVPTLEPAPPAPPPDYFIAWSHPIGSPDGDIDRTNTGLGYWQQVWEKLYAGVVDHVDGKTVVWSLAWEALKDGDVRKPTLTDQPGGKVVAQVGDQSEFFPKGYAPGNGVLSATVNGTPAVNTLACVIEPIGFTLQLMMLTTVGLPPLSPTSLEFEGG